MPAFLVPVDPGQCLIPLEKAVVLIGRQADCDISLTHSRKISRKHCCIAQVNNTFIVRDLGSTNGVFLNGSRIQKEAIITVGDDLIIGDVHFQVQSEAPMTGKKKVGKKAADASKPAESSQAPPAPAPPAPPIAASLRPAVVLPIGDIPLAIPEAEHDFVVETTNSPMMIPGHKSRIDDVIPLAEDEDENS